jgi:hypothetical protein
VLACEYRIELESLSNRARIAIVIYRLVEKIQHVRHCSKVKDAVD